jgi:hypothetical protein
MYEMKDKLKHRTRPGKEKAYRGGTFWMRRTSTGIHFVNTRK